jgi:hypothetical protein
MIGFHMHYLLHAVEIPDFFMRIYYPCKRIRFAERSMERPFSKKQNHNNQEPQDNKKAMKKK